MTLINEIVDVENFVKSKFSGSTTYTQTPPKQPADNTFVVRFQNDRRESETRMHTRADREYQIVYYGDKVSDVLAKMDALSKALYQTQLIPISGSFRYIRVESFSFSQPFLTDNKLYACIGVLSTKVREARDQQAYEKIQHVYTRYL